ncbi:MAG: sensor histidine kinase N-terminal domain-containing protein [Rubrimonas sp.]|uniref:sensor histidine kinase N-terminal domain-containing protein n=1 Tax=Rubrimonas sp. TaxID=2036015 RepID=UPI002FDD2ACD
MFASRTPGRPYSLRRRLMAAMLAGFSVIMAALAAGLWSYARNAADTTFDLLLDGAAIAILDCVTATASGVQVDLPNSALEVVGLAERDSVFYRVTTAEGAVLTGDAELHDPPGQGQRAAEPAPERQFFDAPHSGELVRFVRLRQAAPGVAGPIEFAVQVGQTRSARDAVQRDLIVNGMAALSVLALIGLVFAQTAIHLAMRSRAGIEADTQGRDPANLAPLRASPRARSRAWSPRSTGSCGASAPARTTPSPSSRMWRIRSARRCRPCAGSWSWRPKPSIRRPSAPAPRRRRIRRAARSG